jgi:hypothetical protein
MVCTFEDKQDMFLDEKSLPNKKTTVNQILVLTKDQLGFIGLDESPTVF